MKHYIAKSIFTFMVSACAFAMNPEYKLDHQVKQVETFTRELKSEIQVTTSNGENPAESIDVKSLSMVTQAVVLQKLSEGEGVNQRTRHLKLRKYNQIDDKVQLAFDSTDDSQMAKALATPSYAPLIALLDASTITHLNPQGKVIHLQVFTKSKSESIKQYLEYTLHQQILGEMIILPDNKITLGETWTAGNRTMNFSEVGRLKYGIQAKLNHIDFVNNRDIAVIHIEAVNPRIPDGDALANQIELDSFILSGDIEYSFEKHRIVSQEVEGVLVLNSWDGQGEKNIIKTITHSLMKEQA